MVGFLGFVFHEMARKLMWLPVVVLLCASAFAYLFGLSRHVTISLSKFGCVTIILIASLHFIFTAAIYIRESNAQSGYSFLINEKKANYSRWISGGIVNSLLAAFAAMALSWHLLTTIVPYFQGKQMVQSGVIMSITNYYKPFFSCAAYLRVMFESGEEHDVCYIAPVWFGIGKSKYIVGKEFCVGDGVSIMENVNLLGVAVERVERRNDSKRCHSSS